MREDSSIARSRSHFLPLKSINLIWAVYPPSLTLPFTRRPFYKVVIYLPQLSFICLWWELSQLSVLFILWVYNLFAFREAVPFYNLPPGLTLLGSFFTIFWNFLTGAQKLACDLDSEVHVTVSPFKKYVFSASRFEQDFSLRFQTFALRLSSIVKMRGALRDFSSSQPQRWSIRGWTIRCGLVECYADTRVLWRLPSYPRRPVMTTIPTPFLILSSRREGRLLPRRRHRSWPQRCLVGNLLLFICLVDNLK